MFSGPTFRYYVVKNGQVLEEKCFTYLAQCIHCSQMRIRRYLNEYKVPFKIKKEIYNSYEFKCGCCYYFKPNFYIYVDYSRYVVVS